VGAAEREVGPLVHAPASSAAAATVTVTYDPRLSALNPCP